MNKTSLLIVAAVAASCVPLGAESAAVQAAAEGQPRVKIVTATFPIYDWAREVLGDRLPETDLVLLQQDGCIAYDVFASATRPGVLLICETWRDEAAATDQRACGAD